MAAVMSHRTVEPVRVCRATLTGSDDWLASARERYPSVRQMRRADAPIIRHHVAHAEFGDIGLSIVTTSGATVKSIDADYWFFCRVQSGVFMHRAQDGECNVDRGRAVLLPPSVGDMSSGQDYVALHARIGRAAVYQAIEALTGKRSAQVQMAKAPVLNATALHKVERLIALATNAILKSSAVISPGLARLYEQAILLQLADAVVANNNHATPAYELRRLRTAEAYIEAHLMQPIGPADIAAAAGMSVRSLQYAIRDHHGMTPAGLLRHWRLSRTRAMLAEGTDPAEIPAIAARFGFGGPQAITEAYAAQFGEQPRDTARRARRSGLTR